MIPVSVTFVATDEGQRAAVFHLYLTSSKGVLERIADIDKVSDVQPSRRTYICHIVLCYLLI